MKVYSIYLGTCLPTGKQYVGFTENFVRRMKMYEGLHCASQPKIYNALKKYGWDNFKFEIICQSKDRQHLLEEMEPYFIKQYNSLKNGLNSNSGGQGHEMTVMTKEKLSKINKERLNKILIEPKYFVLFPDGKTREIIYNQMEFRQKHNLHWHGLYNDGRSKGFLAIPFTKEMKSILQKSKNTKLALIAIEKHLKFIGVCLNYEEFTIEVENKRQEKISKTFKTKWKNLKFRNTHKIAMKNCQRSPKYLVTHSDGKKEIVYNETDFCKRENLVRRSLTKNKKFPNFKFLKFTPEMKVILNAF